MDRICRILWPYLWCCLLLCLLSIAANSEAATRKHVSMPSAQSVAQGGGAPSRNGSALTIPGVHQGEYIPRTPGGTAGTPIKVLPTVDFHIPRTIKAATSAIRGGVPGVVASVAAAAIIAAVDGVIDNSGAIKVPSIQEVPSTDPNHYQWTIYGNPKYSSPLAACKGTWTNITDFQPQRMSDTAYSCVSPKAGGSLGQAVRSGNTCPPDSGLDPTTGSCRATLLVDPSESDWDLMEEFADAQNSEWMKDLLNAACSGSPSPGSCYDSLKSNSKLLGPSSASGPSSSTSGTFTRPDGTIGTISSNTTTNYDITYGPNYFDYSKTETTTTNVDGEKVSEETTTEGIDIDTEIPADQEKEEKEDQPSPCVSGCDGPVYDDLYTPTEDVKEDFLADYMTRVSNLPILDAVAGMFTVSVGGSCPVWEYHGSMAVMGAVMPIDLTFDFFCLSWVVALKPWLQVIFALIGSYMAIRVALL